MRDSPYKTALSWPTPKRNLKTLLKTVYDASTFLIKSLLKGVAASVGAKKLVAVAEPLELEIGKNKLTEISFPADK